MCRSTTTAPTWCLECEVDTFEIGEFSYMVRLGCPVPGDGEGRASAQAFQGESLPEWQRIHDRYAASLASA